MLAQNITNYLAAAAEAAAAALSACSANRIASRFSAMLSNPTAFWPAQRQQGSLSTALVPWDYCSMRSSKHRPFM